MDNGDIEILTLFNNACRAYGLDPIHIRATYENESLRISVRTHALNEATQQQKFFNALGAASGQPLEKGAASCRLDGYQGVADVLRAVIEKAPSRRIG
jgi:hypothetical protein